ncbi:MAG: hypothetical protein LUO89_11260 [Methanothrix sp.]|nr:hypothetical protein [Methanothrix sp.]
MSEILDYALSLFELLLASGEAADFNKCLREAFEIVNGKEYPTEGDMKPNHRLVICRIVHYTSGLSAAPKCMPAVIVEVRNPQTVDLQVFKSGSQHGTVGEVGVLHGVEVGKWHWNDECPYEKREEAHAAQPAPK